MEFKDFLIEKNIPFKEEGTDIWVEDIDLMPYMDEVLLKFPELDFDFKVDDFDMGDLEEWEDIDLDELGEELEDEDWEEYWEDEEDGE
jgi:hypothetical protein